ncbi:hypothetical protein MTR67_051661 [Solanum verrucosum]|uniref:Uncharacterized protein n=1 Tax=Solanum verrucosum TaxID=315347 RepID=A0AAF1A0B6_SOLVR|nr:hypothetical protein MTR67_051661 [Solanum verrucosum]
MFLKSKRPAWPTKAIDKPSIDPRPVDWVRGSGLHQDLVPYNREASVKNHEGSPRHVNPSTVRGWASTMFDKDNINSILGGGHVLLTTPDVVTSRAFSIPASMSFVEETRTRIVFYINGIYVELIFLGFLTPSIYDASTRIKNGRGKTRGKGLEKMKKAMGSKMKIDIPVGRGRPTKPVQSAKLSNEFGIIARNFISLPNKWKELTREDRDAALIRCHKRCDINKVNRTKLKSNHFMGSKAFVAARAELGENEPEKVEPDRIEFYKHTHYKSKKGWSSLEAETHYELRLFVPSSTAFGIKDVGEHLATWMNMSPSRFWDLYSCFRQLCASDFQVLRGILWYIGFGLLLLWSYVIV